MPRYVVLEHTGTASYKPGRHWDLMLETGKSLRTWELEAVPAPRCSQAISLPNHRLDYLDYEGPVAGDRGTVRRWDWGLYETIRQDPLVIEIRLHGQQLQGDLRLVLAVDDAVDRWQVTFEPS